MLSDNKVVMLPITQGMSFEDVVHLLLSRVGRNGGVIMVDHTSGNGWMTSWTNTYSMPT